MKEILGRIYPCVLPILLLFGSVFLLIKTGGGCFSHPLRSLKILLTPEKTENGVSPLRALSVALAGTLGVGNIAGVALALSVGGAGALFFMAIMAVPAAFIKYCEVTLSLSYRPYGRETGGAMYYIKAAFFRHPAFGKGMSALFACLCLAAALLIGTLSQANAIGAAFRDTFHVNPLYVGIVLALMTGAVVFGGLKGISSVTEKLVPLMTVGYCAVTLYAILSHSDRILPSLSLIWKESFTMKAIIGGSGGYIVGDALRTGAARGLFSNEAGCGTAPLAHAAAKTAFPAKQGICGVLEVLIDTLLLCTLTGMMILTSGVPLGDASGGGITLAVQALSVIYGSAASPITALFIGVFAFATVLSWAYYGRAALSDFTHECRYLWLFNGTYCLSLIPGAVLDAETLYSAADAILFLLTALNMTAVLHLYGRVKYETDKLFSAAAHTLP